MKFINPASAACVAILVLTCSLVGRTALGQGTEGSYGIAPTTPLENCSVDQWTGENGLLSNNLTSVFQANDGFLWITTNNGLMRFDGMHLDIYNQEIIKFLSTDAFYRIYQDKNNTLWFASRGSGIVKNVDNTFSQLLPENQTIPKSLRTLLIQDDGTIWGGSDNKGLIRIKDSVVTKISHPELDDAIIMALEAGPDGTIYIGTNSRGLLKYQHGLVEEIPIDQSLNASVNFVKHTGDGVLYIGTTEGLYVMRDGIVTLVDFLEKIQVNNIIMDGYGSVWIGTERGLARINEKYGVKEFLKAGKNFKGAHITGLCMDREGSLWMSTGKSGLLRLKESLIRNYSEINGLSVDRVNVITEAPDGKFYVCLDDGFVNVIEDGKISELQIDNDSWNESVRDILVEDNGTIWMASYKGLLKKQGSREKLFTTDNGLSSNSVRRIFKDRDGVLWLATRTGGVMRMTGDKVQKVFGRGNGLTSDYILAIEQDQAGRIIIGTHSGGLNVINPDGTLENFHINGDDDGVLIFNVHVDEQGELWLATTIGLYHFSFKDRKFTKLAITDVVKGESYFDWVEDKKGSIWIPTNIGIIELLKKDVRSFLDGKISSVKSKLYNNFDGMRNKECTGATRSMLSKSGEVWVPTIEGICIINPARKGVNKIVPPVYITEIITDTGVIHNPKDEVIIEPGNFRLTIKFTSLSFLAPNKVKFRYKIEGIDPDWMNAQPRSRSVDYTNLPPGKYVFSVIATNNDGVWNQKGVKLPIQVKPFFYETAGFYVLLLIFFVVTSYSIYRWRVKAVEQKNTELLKVNSELDRFVYSASHDLRAPLASILGLVKLTKLDPDPDNRVQYLQKVETSIHKLDGFIHDIINYSRNARTELEANPVNFKEVVDDTLEGLRYQEKSDKIRKSVAINGSGVFYTDVKRLNVVLYNLITNAIKYHNIDQADPYIAVGVNYSSKEATIEISDNGIGISETHLQNIFKMFYRADERSSGSGLGLFIAKEAIDKLKGTLTVTSKVGQGSTFVLTIPSLSQST